MYKVIKKGMLGKGIPRPPMPASMLRPQMPRQDARQIEPLILTALAMGGDTGKPPPSVAALKTGRV